MNGRVFQLRPLWVLLGFWIVSLAAVTSDSTGRDSYAAALSFTTEVSGDPTEGGWTTSDTHVTESPDERAPVPLDRDLDARGIRPPPKADELLHTEPKPDLYPPRVAPSPAASERLPYHATAPPRLA